MLQYMGPWEKHPAGLLIRVGVMCLPLFQSTWSYLSSFHPQGNGPLAEIDLWRERNATLSALTQQLKLPLVKKVLEVLTAANIAIVDSLQIVINELCKHHVEAVDNVRFLSTLERHLKVGFYQLYM